MNFGPFTIIRRRRAPSGQYQEPWDRLTEDDLSPQLRFALARVARSVVKDYLQELQDTTDVQYVTIYPPCQHRPNAKMVNFIPCKDCQT